MANMKEMERLARELAEAESRLEGQVREYNLGIEAVRRKYMKGIGLSVRRVEFARARLHDAVEAHPELFEKRKTSVFHGVRFGWKKLKGKMSWKSSDNVVRLVHKIFPDRAKDLLRLKEAPDKDALAKLPATDLKKLGVTVIEDGDAPYIKLLDGEGEKLVKEFMKGYEGKEAG